jgi:hypothetical protein
MAYLVLDLDLTTFIANIKGESEPEDEINPYQTLTPIGTNGTLCGGKVKAHLRLINQKELSSLIEKACTKHDGLIILTAGLWDTSIRNILADYLDLSEKAANLVRDCYFHSPLTDQPLHKLAIQETKHMPKSKRLEKIIEYRPELRGKRFVTLDDDEDHTEAFKTMFNQTMSVLATPHLADKDYYKKAETFLEMSALAERTILHPNNVYNGHIKVSFFKQGTKRKEMDEPNKENSVSKKFKAESV